jgi:hypothetical protein
VTPVEMTREEYRAEQRIAETLDAMNEWKGIAEGHLSRIRRVRAVLDKAPGETVLKADVFEALGQRPKPGTE